jgi:formate hydrogenlyase subunit 3/multisubunit Na+/H+ antiporter MnhD subunit
MLMMGSSALLALAERGWGTIGGYSWLASSGLAWLALSLGTEPGIHLSAWALWVRVVPLLGMAFALAAYRRMAGTTEPGRVSMAQGPWVIGLLLGSGLAMLDAPPFPGFAARWAMTRLLLPAHPLPALGLIGLPGLLGWALLRNLLAREPLDRPLRPMPRAAIGFGIAWWTAELLLLLAAPWLGIPLQSLARAWIRTP